MRILFMKPPLGLVSSHYLSSLSLIRFLPDFHFLQHNSLCPFNSLRPPQLLVAPKLLVSPKLLAASFNSLPPLNSLWPPAGPGRDYCFAPLRGAADMRLRWLSSFCDKSSRAFMSSSESWF